MLPLPTANPLFAVHFERAAQEELGALTSGRRLGERVREPLGEDRDAHRLAESSVETCAARLRTSPRTLQRGLGAEGTSFARELEAVRHRAFKRWTGGTPEQVRQRSAPPDRTR